MKIQSMPMASVANLPARPPGVTTASLEPQAQLQDGFIKSEGPAPEPPPGPNSNSFGQRVIGGFAGALVGILAGHAGPAGLAAAAGLGAAAVTLAAAGPLLKDGLQQGLSGDLLNDVVLTCGTVAAGAMLTATMAGSAAGLAYPLGLALPGATPVLGGLIGASAGAYLGMRN